MGVTNFTPGSNSNGSNGSNGPGGPNVPGGMVPALARPSNTSSNDIPDYLINYNAAFKDAPAAKYRDGVIDQTIAALISMRKPNPLLVGSAGVGKTRVVEDVARRLANDDPSIPATLKGWTIYEIPVASLNAGLSYVGQTEARAAEIVAFFSDPKRKAIAFIDEIHTLLTSRTLNETVQIFKAPLARGDFHLIGATTNTELRFINDDPALARRFENVIVDELTPAQTVEVVADNAAQFIAHHQGAVAFDTGLAERLVTIADTTLPSGMHRPDNALTLLDRTLARVTMNAAKMRATMMSNAPGTVVTMPTLSVNEDMIAATAERMAHGDIEVPRFDAKSVIANAKTLVLGQDHVIEQVVEHARRLTLNLFPATKPTTYLFAGPSGVGKTSLAHIIAENLTGQKALVLNMSEYSEKSAVSKLLGSSAGYVGHDSRGELPFDPLLSNPHRVIVLDELEKAHPEIIHTFLQVLDAGHLQNSRGMNYDFSKAIIIATTNAGRETMESKNLGFGDTSQNNSTLSRSSLTNALKQHFPPEFIGRFTDVFAFNTITKSLYEEVIVETYNRERARILDEQPFVILPDVLNSNQIEDLVKTYVPNLGARPAMKSVRDFIETHAIV